MENAVRAVMSQTWPNIELLVIDDGSTDSTWQILETLRPECEKCFTRVVFQRQSNKGVSKTLRTLQSLAKGAFITGCASDDCFAVENAVERMVQTLLDNPQYGVVAANCQFIDAKGQICYWNKDRSICYKYGEATYHTFVDFLKETLPYFEDGYFGKYATLLRRNYIPNCFMYKTELLAKIEPLPNYPVLEDMFMWLQLSKITLFKYIDAVLFSYRWHDTNTSKIIGISDVERKTREYEEKIINRYLQSCNTSQYIDGVIDAMRNGFLYRSFAIKYLAEIKIYIKICEVCIACYMFKKFTFTWKLKRFSLNYRILSVIKKIHDGLKNLATSVLQRN